MVNIKTLALIIVCFLASVTLWSQPLYRTQIAPFSQRSDALSDTHSTSALYFDFAPTLTRESGGKRLYHKSFTHPAQWSDGLKVLHLENLPSSSLLLINDVAVAQIDDIFTPVDIDVTSYLHQGENSIEIITFAQSPASIDSGLERVERDAFSGSYICSQSALHIRDFLLSLHPNEKGGGYLQLEVVVANLYSQPREVEVGFDIYNPINELVEYDFAKKTIAAGGLDTISFSRPLKGTAPYRWGVKGEGVTRKGVGTLQSPLYSLMLYTRLGGILREYIPFKVGYTDLKTQGGVLTSFGERVELRSSAAKAAATREESEKELEKLRSEGVNLLIAEYAQPSFFYELADKMGFFLIDAVSISTPDASKDRAVGGTPSNNPALLSEYICRGENAYYRTRNHTCVIAYSLGSQSGNGYNMYRLYETLRHVETHRPIVYKGANGEWNSDLMSY